MQTDTRARLTVSDSTTPMHSSRFFRAVHRISAPLSTATRWTCTLVLTVVLLLTCAARSFAQLAVPAAQFAEAIDIPPGDLVSATFVTPAGAPAHFGNNHRVTTVWGTQLLPKAGTTLGVLSTGSRRTRMIQAS